MAPPLTGATQYTDIGEVTTALTAPNRALMMGLSDLTVVAAGGLRATAMWSSLRLSASAQTVALYLAEHAGVHKVVTLIRRCSAISAIHQAAELPTPTATPLVRTTLAGIRRVHGIAPTPKNPLVAHQVRRMLDALPTDPAKVLIAARDRTLLVIGFYGALRRLTGVPCSSWRQP